MQVTFIFEAAKADFFIKSGQNLVKIFFLSDLRIQFEPLLVWECASVCHNLKTEEEGIYAKRQKYERSNWHTSDLYIGH